MKALTAIALTTAMFAIAAQPVLADDDYRVVSKKVLAEYCATVPADSRTVATLMGVEPPPEIPFETAQLSPMARSFYGENKRVSNAAIKATGYRFLYPDYRSAFYAMWKEGNWSGSGENDARSPMKQS